MTQYFCQRIYTLQHNYITVFGWGMWLREHVYNSHAGKMGMWKDGPSTAEPVVDNLRRLMREEGTSVDEGMSSSHSKGYTERRIVFQPQCLVSRRKPVSVCWMREKQELWDCDQEKSQSWDILTRLGGTTCLKSKGTFKGGDGRMEEERETGSNDQAQPWEQNKCQYRPRDEVWDTLRDLLRGDITAKGIQPQCTESRGDSWSGHAVKGLRWRKESPLFWTLVFHT